jgi:hypothetical protein
MGAAFYPITVTRNVPDLYILKAPGRGWGCKKKHPEGGVTILRHISFIL